jgi:RNA polymerase sigma factor (TIGR02999 family)
VTTTPAQPITQLLSELRSGSQTALDQLTDLLYPQLRRIAHRYVDAEPGPRTLQATELVHEAYERLANAEIDWKSRAHFFAVAARMMRRILVDRARTRLRGKRGGGATHLTLDESIPEDHKLEPDVLELDEALGRLEKLDERKSRILELRFFGGLSYEETCEVLGISTSTLDRELRLAKAWLYQELRRT